MLNEQARMVVYILVVGMQIAGRKLNTENSRLGSLFLNRDLMIISGFSLWNSTKLR